MLAVVDLFTGLTFLLGGTALLTIAAGAVPLEFVMAHFPIGVAFLALGALSSTVPKRWVWTVGLAVAVISVVDDLVAFSLVSLPFDGAIGTAVVTVTAMIAALILQRSSVKAFFR